VAKRVLVVALTVFSAWIALESAAGADPVLSGPVAGAKPVASSSAGVLCRACN